TARALALLGRGQDGPGSPAEAGTDGPAQAVGARHGLNLGLGAAGAGLGGWLWALVLSLAPLPVPLIDGGVLLRGCAFWARAEGRLPTPQLRQGCSVLITLMSLWLAYASRPLYQTFPTWIIPEDHSPINCLEPGVRYLSVLTYEDIFPQGSRRPGGTD